ncbi:hypothetical protein AVEN_216138-1 [Araneus ventricosus]|uniref:Uncharacterized protein n=1 Tax=Araneus ventricosus TaxID=182803 RepID=A0A4Y2VJ52_ARAVE|nr:hypothetical protein AVEN_216138-1 [Araneus ventricosus]
MDIPLLCIRCRLFTLCHQVPKCYHSFWYLPQVSRHQQHGHPHCQKILARLFTMPPRAQVLPHRFLNTSGVSRKINTWTSHCQNTGFPSLCCHQVPKCRLHAFLPPQVRRSSLLLTSHSSQNTGIAFFTIKPPSAQVPPHAFTTSGVEDQHMTSHCLKYFARLLHYATKCLVLAQRFTTLRCPEDQIHGHPTAKILARLFTMPPCPSAMLSLPTSGCPEDQHMDILPPNTGTPLHYATKCPSAVLTLSYHSSGVQKITTWKP